MARILPINPRHPLQMPAPSSSLSLSLSPCRHLCCNLIFLPVAVFVPVFVFAVVAVAVANILACRRLCGNGKTGRGGAAVARNAAGSSWPQRSSSRRWPLLFVFVLVAVAVAGVHACRPPHSKSEAGEVGAVAARGAAGLLLALAIIVVMLAFALALWMQSSSCSKMALLVLEFLTVLVLALALALTQLLARPSTMPCVVLIERPIPFERQPTPPPPAWGSCPCLRAHSPCIPSAPPPLV
jgi:hypothetical protein